MKFFELGMPSCGLKKFSRYIKATGNGTKVNRFAEFAKIYGRAVYDPWQVYTLDEKSKLWEMGAVSVMITKALFKAKPLVKGLHFISKSLRVKKIVLGLG